MDTGQTVQDAALLQPFVDIPYVDPVSVDPNRVTAQSGAVGALQVTPTGVQAGQDSGQVNWDATKGNERIWVGDPANPSVVIGQLFSKTGIYEYGIWTDVGYFTGSITATTGSIGGWTISATTLFKNNVVLDSAGKITLGTGTDIIILDALDTTYRMVVGSNVYASAPFSVTKTGAMKATLGTIGGWTIGANTLSSTNIIIDSVNQNIRSSNYVAGVSGFSISQDLVEAENIKARGMLRGVAFQYDVVSAVGGQMMVTNSDTLDVDMTALDASTLTTTGATALAVNDILLIRGVTASGIQEEYLRVTSIASAPTYVVTRDLAAAFSANNNPVWLKGTTIVQQGKSDGVSVFSGGWLRLLGQGTNSPYYSVFRRTGIAYNNYDEVARFGNLNGIGGFVADTFGVFIGDSSSGNYLKYDTVTGNLIVNGRQFTADPVFGDGSDGNVTIAAGTTTLTSDMFYDNLTVNGTLNTGGFRIFVKNTFTLSSTGTVARNGANGSNGTAGGNATFGNGGAGAAALASGSLFGSVAGADGSRGGVNAVGVAGLAGNAAASSLGSSLSATSWSGGAGGGGSLGGGYAGGARGTNGTYTVAAASVRNLTNATLMIDSGAATVTQYKGSPSFGGAGGGGSGGQGSGGTGGGGGGGGGSATPGGLIMISARNITIASGGQITANGGTGGNGGAGGNAVAANSGGGGGGGAGAGGDGGIIVLIYTTYSNSGSVVASAGAAGSPGAGGTKNGTGANGSTGGTPPAASAGKVIPLPLT